MMLVFLAAAAALLLAVGILYGGAWPEGLSFEIRFADQTVYAGEETIVTEEVSNRKRMALPETEAAFRLPKGVTFPDAENIVLSDYVYKRDIFALRGMEKVTRSYRLLCPKRGRYAVSQAVVRGWSFFHTKSYEKRFPISEELLVYPAWMDVSKIEAMCTSLTGSLPAGRDLYEDPFTFAGIRDYQPQDPMKQVNWKASARNASWMVNTFESVRSEQVFVFLDVSDERIVKEDILREAAISTAASLVRKLSRRGNRVGFAVNTDPPFIAPGGRGRRQLGQIECFLTEDFAGRNMISLDDLYQRCRQDAGGSICVFVSAEEPERTLESLRMIRDKNMPPMLLARPVSEGGSVGLEVMRIS